MENTQEILHSENSVYEIDQQETAIPQKLKNSWYPCINLCGGRIHVKRRHPGDSSISQTEQTLPYPKIIFRV